KTIDPSNYQIEYFQKIIKNFKKKKFLKKNQTLLILLSIMFAIFCIFLIAEGLFLIVFGPIALITIAIIGYKYFNNNKKNKTNKTTNNRYTQEEKTTERIIIEPENIIDESVFFDLNENERIEKKLSEIWSRYKGKIDNQIIN